MPQIQFWGSAPYFLDICEFSGSSQCLAVIITLYSTLSGCAGSLPLSHSQPVYFSVFISVLKHEKQHLLQWRFCIALPALSASIIFSSNQTLLKSYFCAKLLHLLLQRMCLPARVQGTEFQGFGLAVSVVTCRPSATVQDRDLFLFALQDYWWHYGCVRDLY